MRRNPPKTQSLFIKNCVFFLPCINVSHLQIILHLMQDTYQDIFSTAQNRFWTYRSWYLLALLPFLVSLLPHQQNVSLWLFSSGDTKKVPHLVWDWVNRGVGYGDRAVFSQTLLNAQCGVVWAGALLNHPSWNGQTRWKSLPKKILWSLTQPLTTMPAGALIQMGS